MSAMSTSSTPLRLTQGVFDSPLGTLLTLHDQDGVLRALDFLEFESRMHKLLDRQVRSWEIVGDKQGTPLAAELRSYFDGDMAAFDQVPVATGGTPFQREVWAALRRIPAGRTRAYGDLAHDLQRKNGSRAVGLANGSNPIALVVPCHRVIGADGTLTGFAGGLQRKQWLLHHEASSLGRGNLELTLN